MTASDQDMRFVWSRGSADAHLFLCLPWTRVFIVLLTFLAAGLNPGQVSGTEEASTLFQSGAESAESAPPEAADIEVDDDGPPVLAVESVVRVEEWAGTAAFSITLSSPSAFEVSAAYATMDGTAMAGADYVGVSGTLRIAPGDTAGVISVPILDDNGIEGEETFTLTLSGVQNAVLGSATSLGMIVDNESVASLRINGWVTGEDARNAVSRVAPSGQSAADELHIAESMPRGMLLESSGACSDLYGRGGDLYDFSEGESCTGVIYCERTDGTPAPADYHLTLSLRDQRQRLA